MTKTKKEPINGRKKTKSKFILHILKDSKLFITFSFFSCLLPIIYCLIASFIKPNGSQAVMAIGYVSPFLLAFIQISFSMSMIIFSLLRKTKKNSNDILNDEHILMSSAWWLSILLGALMVVFYTLSSFLYMYFSNNRPNTQATLTYGLDFIFSSVLGVFLFPLLSTIFFYIYNKDKTSSFLLVILLFVSIMSLSFLIGINGKLNVSGIGLATSISILFVLFISILIIKFQYPFLLFWPNQVRFINFQIIKKVTKESMTSISLSVFKGVAIVCLSFTIPLTISGFVPLSYQMSRVLWFNMMYFIPFIGIGFGEVIRAHYLLHSENEECNMNHCWQNDWTLVLFVFILTIGLCFGAIYLIGPLTRFYTRNDFNPFYKNKMPEIKGWGTPSLAPKELPLIDRLSELQFNHEFPQLKKFIPLTGNWIKDQLIKIQNAAIAAENLQKVKDWTQLVLEDNKETNQAIAYNFTEWIEWLHQSNEEGCSLIDFLQEKYKLDKEWLNSVIKSLINKDGKWKEQLSPILKNAVPYFVYLWLYSTTDSSITESFLNLKPLIKYNDIIKSLENNEINIITLISKYKVQEILPSLYFKRQTFESKSMIYISIFSSLNSVWAILLQTNARNFKKGMPYWLMMIVYFLCIGGLVTFGVLFGVTFTDKLGNSNPFQFLDAWTFPLVIISTFAISVVTIKSIKSYKFLKNKKIK